MPAHLRRPLAALAAAALTALSAAACSDDAGGGDEDAITIGFVNGSTTEFHTCLEQSVQDAAADLGVEVLVANSQQDAAKELSNIEDMIAQQVDAVVVQTVSADALEGDIAKANGAGVPIFLTSIVADADPEALLGAVETDLHGIGAAAAGFVTEDSAGAPVTAGIIAGAPGAASDILVGGFKDAVGDNVEVVAEQPGMFDRATAQDVAENMIQGNPELDYVFVANEDMAFGALNAFQAADSDVKIVANNGTDAGLQAIRDGEFAATVANSPYVLGQMAVDNIVGLLEDQEVEPIQSNPFTLITADNLDDAPGYCG
ncbi:ribose ABC transporter substrate-binding protein RbsB [Glycomyces endophyticus]|uniref:Ribose ABC transporter substrate-binding protein RbsB n=1 Tax=Glycomyces endophyticus TaxID=480996 RepID=A0ABN2HJE6_9ACTN